MCQINCSIPENVPFDKANMAAFDPLQNDLLKLQRQDSTLQALEKFLPETYRKAAICEAQNSICGGHNATHKTYLKISSLYFWLKIFQDINQHTKICSRSQQRKNQLKNKLHCNLYKYWIAPISGYTEIWFKVDDKK